MNTVAPVVNTLCLDIGGSKLLIALFEGERMARRERRETDREGGREWMLGQIESIVAAWRKDTAIHRCAIGFGGPVQFARQRVALSTHVAGWRDYPLVEHMKDLLNAPTVMDNDANTGALGEAVYGASRDGSSKSLPMFYMTLSTGIGGGIILEDRTVYRGVDSYAGEIGHITIRPDGPECLCGARGCFERMCCGLWLERDYGKPARELMSDPAFVERYVVDVVLGLKAAVMLLNPARIVLGGGITKAGDALFKPLRAELRRQITTWSQARLELVPAVLGDDSVLWGTLALASILTS